MKGKFCWVSEGLHLKAGAVNFIPEVDAKKIVCIKMIVK